MNNKILFVCLLISLCLLQAIAKPAKRIPDIVLGHPVKAIYIDWHLNWNTPQQSILDAVNAGYNVIIISFYLSGGTAADMAQAWAALDDNTKQTTIQQAHSKGAVVTVSLGGSTDSPYQHDAQATGQAVSNWAKSQYLDGVDFDLENLVQGFTAGGMSDKDTVAWIAKLTQAAIDGFGGTGVISHAPQGPYFGPIGATNTWTGPTGGYSSVYALVPNITFFNVQFYNQGASCYTDYNGLFLESGTSCPVFPNTSVAEIHYAGIPYNKIVVGKPVTSADASNGWVDGSTLGGYFTKAQQQLGWNAGLMGWVWNDASTCAAWVSAVYPNGGSSSGVSGPSVAAASVSSSASSSSGTSTSSSSSSSSSSSGTSGGGCNGATSGMVCADKNNYYYCPSGPTEPCGAGTVCINQGGNPPSIQCGWPSNF